MDATYAGLFVRDFFDQAEESVLASYRTMVAKGVSPPLAVNRAAAVYGVASSGLGKYLAMASDPKANPIALTDAADRALLEYVSKMVGIEAEDTKEPVSKAEPLLTAQDQWDAQEHPRDAVGRFADLTGEREGYQEQVTEVDPTELAMFRSMMGLGGQAAPDVGSTPAARRAARVARVRRANALVKPQASLVATKQESAQLVSPKLTSARLSSAALRSATLKASAIVDLVQPPVPEAAGHDDSAMAMYSDESREGFKELTRNIEVYLPFADGQDLRGQMPGTSKQKVLRLGHLLDAAYNHYNINDPTDPDANPEAKDAFGMVASTEKLTEYGDDNGGKYGPAASEITEDEYVKAEHEGMSRDKYVKELIKKEGMVGGERNPKEEPHVHFAIDHSDRRSHVLVHVQDDPISTALKPNNKVRPKPTVVQFTLPKVVARVDDEPGRHFEQLTLDKNQAYLSADLIRMYDMDEEVFVNEYLLTPISDEEAAAIQKKSGLSKALDTMERTSFDQMHPRSEDGEFRSIATRARLVPTAPSDIGRRWSTLERSDESLKAPLTEDRAKRRASRVSRVNRVQQMATQSQAPIAFDTKVNLTSAPLGSARLSSPRLTSAQLQASKLSEILRDPIDDTKMVLDDNHVYRVMNHDEFTKLVKKHTVSGGIAGIGSSSLKTTFLHPEGKSQILSLSEYGPDEVMRHMNNTTEELAGGKAGQYMKQLFKHTVRSDTSEHEYEDLEALRQKIDAELSKRPNMAYATADPEPPEMDYGSSGVGQDLMDDVNPMDAPQAAGESVTWVVHGSTRPVAPLYLIEMDPWNGWPDPDADLTFLGDYKGRDITYKRPDDPRSPVRADELSSSVVSNAMIKVYKAEFSRYVFNPVNEDELPRS
jgi:hypothetical protein